jgi:hypothetical protein
MVAALQFQGQQAVRQVGQALEALGLLARRHQDHVVAMPGVLQRVGQALAMVLADVGVGDDGHALALEQRGDVLARPSIRPVPTTTS